MMLSGIRSKAHHRGDCHPLQNSGNLWRSGGLGEALNYPHQASLFFHRKLANHPYAKASGTAALYSTGADSKVARATHPTDGSRRKNTSLVTKRSAPH